MPKWREPSAPCPIVGALRRINYRLSRVLLARQHMPILKPRSRLVYFRVSEDEFHEFSQMCAVAQARSISDLARSAMKQMRKQQAQDELMADRLKSFDELMVLMVRINEKLDQMTVLLEANVPSALRKGDSTD